MAKKSTRKAKKATGKSDGRKFSMVSLHNKLDDTLRRLQKERPSQKRNELIALVKGLRSGTRCPQQMLIDLGV
jgi:hypothetical protein